MLIPKTFKGRLPVHVLCVASAALWSFRYFDGKPDRVTAWPAWFGIVLCLGVVLMLELDGWLQRRGSWKTAAALEGGFFVAAIAGLGYEFCFERNFITTARLVFHGTMVLLILGYLVVEWQKKDRVESYARALRKRA